MALTNMKVHNKCKADIQPPQGNSNPCKKDRHLLRHIELKKISLTQFLKLILIGIAMQQGRSDLPYPRTPKVKPLYMGLITFLSARVM